MNQKQWWEQEALLKDLKSGKRHSRQREERQQGEFKPLTAVNALNLFGEESGTSEGMEENMAWSQLGIQLCSISLVQAPD